MAKAKKQRILFFILLLLIIGGLVYWLMHRHEISTDDAAIESNVVALASKVPGYVVTLNITDNQLVTAGDVIAQVDPRDYEIALARAQAQLASAEAKLSGAGHSYASTKQSAPLTVTSAQSQVEGAQAELERAEKELTRMKKLGDAARSRQQLESAVAAEKAAASSLADAKARLQSSRIAPNTVASAAASVKDVQAAVDSAKASVAQAEKDLADTSIRAPFDGRITQRNVELGAYVQPGQQLLSVVSDQYWVVANYKENQLEGMKPGQPVSITIDAYPGASYRGTVDSIQRGTGARFSAFPAENATGNFVKIVQRVPVKITFETRPDAALAIGPGMSVIPTVSIQ
ncbi:MAG: HlyD family secretion protein [Pseudomonadota bacterium]